MQEEVTLVEEGVGVEEEEEATEVEVMVAVAVRVAMEVEVGGATTNVPEVQKGATTNGLEGRMGATMKQVATRHVHQAQHRMPGRAPTHTTGLSLLEVGTGTTLLRRRATEVVGPAALTAILGLATTSRDRKIRGPAAITSREGTASRLATISLRGPILGALLLANAVVIRGPIPELRIPDREEVVMTVRIHAALPLMTVAEIPDRIPGVVRDATVPVKRRFGNKGVRESCHCFPFTQIFCRS